MPDNILEQPLDRDGILAARDSDGFVSGLVPMDLSDFIDHDLEAILDLMSEKLVGSCLGMEIDYEPVSVQDDGTLVMRVTVDPSMVLDDLEQE